MDGAPVVAWQLDAFAACAWQGVGKPYAEQLPATHKWAPDP